MPAHLVWMDMEMTGLEPDRDTVIEIATLVTDGELNVLSEGPEIVVHQDSKLFETMDDWNKEHHTKSGLWAKVIASTVSLRQAELETIAFLKKWVGPRESPLCGNSVWQDRRFLARYMPELESYLHYRLVDVSTIKELATRWYPNVKHKKAKGAHRAMDDIRESVDELRFYRQMLFREAKDIRMDLSFETSRAAASTLIQIKEVSKTYMMGETEVSALRGVSLNIPKGGIVALMGPSGSGKSTLLNLIGALDRPSNGVVVVAGQDIGRLTRDQQSGFRNATIGFVFQNFNLVPVLTTLENVLLPAQLGRQDLGEPLETRATRLLNQVGLGKQINQSVNRLSGGQMQRVAIARALMNKPPIILADEPTANLDHDTADTVLTVLRDLCTSEGATVVIATHDQHVLTYCHRIIRLMDGKLLRDELRE